MGVKKSLKVTKSNDVTEANFSDFSLSSYRVFLNLLAKLQHYDMDNNLIPLSLSNRTCSLSASDYAEEFNVPQNLAYGILKSAVDHLLKTSYSIPIGRDILKINICSQALYKKDSGRIDVEFTPNIMPHIAGLSQKFTMYHLNDVAGFNSIYTTRLFELLMQWKTIGEVTISISSLRFSLGCVSILTSYNNFKQKAFGHAVDEINEQLTLDLTYEEIKNGRSVDAIIFRFRPTFVKKVFDPVTQKDRTQITKPRQKTELTPEELAKKEARRAKEKEYRERHKAKKAEKLTHIDHISDAEIEAQDLVKNMNILEAANEHREDLILPMPGILLDEEELKDFINAPTEIDPEIEKIVMNMSKQEIIELVLQAQKEQEEAKKIINPETKPRKKIFGIF